MEDECCLAVQSGVSVEGPAYSWNLVVSLFSDHGGNHYCKNNPDPQHSVGTWQIT